VTAEPGLTPRFPVMTLDPVLVTVEPPSTAKPCAVPSGGARAALEVSPEGASRADAPQPASWKGRRATTNAAIEYVRFENSLTVWLLLNVVGAEACIRHAPRKLGRMAQSSRGHPVEHSRGPFANVRGVFTDRHQGNSPATDRPQGPPAGGGAPSPSATYSFSSSSSPSSTSAGAEKIWATRMWREKRKKRPSAVVKASCTAQSTLA
jgi:hypothetical protein